MTIITTPKPPLNLYEVVRVTVDDTSGGTLVYEVPTYRIPASGPTPQRDVDTAAILMSVLAADSGGASAPLSLRMWVETDGGSDTYEVVLGQDVDAGGFAVVPINQMILVSGEVLYAEVAAGEQIDLNVSFVLNTREEFTVLP